MITTKNFSFNSSTTLPYTLESGSWDATIGGASAMTMQITAIEDATNDTASGNGTLQSDRTGSLNTNGTPYYEWSGTWEDLGVPAGHTVTACKLDYDWKCATYSGGGTSSTYGPAELRDSGGSFTGTFSASATFSTTTSWATLSGSTITGLSQASNTSIKLRIGSTPRTGFSALSKVTLRFDWVVVTITSNAGVSVATAASFHYRLRN